MSRTCNLAIISDIHYAGANERSRGHEFLEGVESRLTVFLLRLYRDYIWLRDPFAHNHLVDRFIRETSGVDYAIANGDYCANVAYHGIRDPGAFESATECLGKLRAGFGERLRATLGDHELGKKKLGGEAGGLNLVSWHRARNELGVEAFWQVEAGRYLIVGIVSTLIALPVYETEAAESERPEWRALRAGHVAEIETLFRSLKPEQRVLLFCHDPTALPALYRIEAVRNKLAQIERTVIGHLHSKLLLRQSQFLSFMPVLNFGHTSRRITTALREVRYWKRFNILLCPAPFGIEILKDGGYYTAELDPEGRRPARFVFHPLPRGME